MIFRQLLIVLQMHLFVSVGIAQVGTNTVEKPKEFDDFKKKIQQLEEQVAQVEGELEVLRAQSKLLIRRTTVGFLNATYVKGGITLLFPRRRSFDFPTDTGMGFGLGLGHYFGRSHVLEATLDWDIYLSTSLKYRLEIHSETPMVTIAPVVGVKYKLSSLAPFDNFLERPQDVRNFFFVFGAFLGVPMSRSLITMEVDLLTNGQSLFTFAGAVHFFL